MPRGRRVVLRSGTVDTIETDGGKQIVISWFKEEDRDALLRFYRELPKEAQLYLKDDVTNQMILDRLIEHIHDGLALMIVARDGDKIVAETTQHFIHHGWSRHVSELRPLIRNEYKGNGIGQPMIREQIEVASEMGLDKVIVRLLQVQRERRRTLEHLGFVKEATLRDHATDLTGKRHNMIIMSCHVSELWRKMEDLIRETDIPPMAPQDL
jgi:RimJ/RimL family protein N-acetyltransferase